MNQKTEVKPLVLNPHDGCAYPMGRMSAVFKADLDETNSTFSVSEWWLEPNTEGPPVHNHPEKWQRLIFRSTSFASTHSDNFLKAPLIKPG